MELTIEQFFGSGKLNYTANYNFYTPKLEGLMQRVGSWGLRAWAMGHGAA